MTNIEILIVCMVYLGFGTALSILAFDRFQKEKVRISKWLLALFILFWIPLTLWGIYSSDWYEIYRKGEKDD